MSNVCTKCDGKFSTKGKLNSHVRRVHQGHRFKCEYARCGHASKTKYDLTRHIASQHANLRSHKCPERDCSAAFSRAFTLSEHRRLHSGERPYKCDHAGCGAAYKTYAGLYRHAMIHTQMRFPCTVQGCKLAFRTNTDHQRHLKTHTGPFCITCARYVVGEKGELCGVCAIGSNFGAKERTVFRYLADRNEMLRHWVRDTPLGCGNRRRPDGYLDLHVMLDSVNVLFVLEVDENQHRYYDVSCELKRLEQIQERHGGALYLIRYNPDQTGGLEDGRLSTLADRCLEVLTKDHAEATKAFGGLMVEYNGYTEKQVEKIERTWFESQIYSTGD